MLDAVSFILGAFIFTMACAMLATCIALLAIRGRFTIRLLFMMATAVCVIAAFVSALF